MMYLRTILLALFMSSVVVSTARAQTSLAGVGIGATGVPVAPTAAPGTNTTQIATTAFAKANILADVISCPSTIIDYGGGAALSDNTSAFAAAVASNTSQSCVSFPPGVFTFLSPLVVTMPGGAGGLTIVGAGPGVTTLNWANAGGGVTVNLNSHKQGAQFIGFDLTTGQPGGGIAITVNQLTISASSSLDPITVFNRVSAHGSDGYSATNYWNTGFKTSRVSNVNFISTYIAGDATFSAIGIELEGSVAQPTGQFNIIGSNFQCLNQGLVYGNYVQGVTVSGGSNFVCGNYGIIVPPTSTNTDQLAVNRQQLQPQ